MTYKQLADLLGVKKDKVRYLAEQLPAGTVQKIDGVMHMSNHAIDAVVSAINGGELESGVDIPPYDPGDPVGWDWNDIPETAKFRDSAREIPHEQTTNAEFRTDFRTANTDNGTAESSESGNISHETEANGAEYSDNSANSREIPREQTEDCENYSDTANSARNHEIAEYYQKAFLTFTDQYNQQIKSKDEQIKQLTEQLGILSSAIADRDKSHDAAAAVQLSAKDDQIAEKDTQIQRLQDTVDSLTRQLEAERQSREEQGSARKWWQWWKR